MGLRHLLVTSDFPPKIGGIQSYLWELWRRLPADDLCVVTPDQRGAAEWDRTQPYRIVRVSDRWLVPHPGLVSRVAALAREHRAQAILVDPLLPLGLAGAAGPGRRWPLPMGVVLHGAEVTIPGRLPLSSALARRALRAADLVVAAGGYPLAEAERCAGRVLPAVVVPPGVDTRRFTPADEERRCAVRGRWSLPEEATLVLGVSRLVARKGFDVLIGAAGRLAAEGRNVHVVIAGAGRVGDSLARLAAESPAPVHLLGRVADADLPDLYAAADLFAMLCHDRWWGIEQEGFGIVFLEAAAAGIPQVAGRSGGSHEAVEHGVTGLVVDDPRSVPAVAAALGQLVDDPELRARMGRAARVRAEEHFDYDVLARRLAAGLEERFADGGTR